LLDALTTIAARAAAAILTIGQQASEVRKKPDLSPVTAADEAAEAVILEDLARLLPGVPVVSEEAAGRDGPGSLPACFVLVDPLDGTREFIEGRPEFTVNIALVVDQEVVAGLVAAPALGRLWRGIVGRDAERLDLIFNGQCCKPMSPAPIRTRSAPLAGLVATMSRSHLDGKTEAFLSRLPIMDRIAVGSALKFCLLADGKADLYPRLAPTCEWDIAAGHAVLAAAGGTLTAPDGAAIRYGQVKQALRVPAFVAWGDAEAARRYGP
jgi:3'(2'), 5'-bisphosphate nucleotidase